MDGDASESAWEAACEVLNGEVFDEVALSVLANADRVLAGDADDLSQTRRASVLEGISWCYGASDDGEAATRLADQVLLERSWPIEALAARLGAASTAVGMSSIKLEEAIAIAERAVAAGESSDDDECRVIVVGLLKWLADAVARTSPEHRRSLLMQAIEKYADVDTAIDSAEDRLADPLYEGLALADEPGKIKAAEAAFRRAVDAGQDAAWLELAVTLGCQAGREEEEEQALRAAIAAETFERSTYASYLLGCLLHFSRGDRAEARAAFGHATTGEGWHAVASLKELAMLAALERDHEARGALIAELAGRSFVEWDTDARGKDYRKTVALSRLGYARPLIAARAKRWRRQRRKAQSRAEDAR